MDGILVVNKPAGWTSHDVVAWIRRLLRIKRVGHAGTLDPLATGVLLVCVGQATRVAEYLMASPKSYRARIQLGMATDTYDVEGEIVGRHPVPELSYETLQDALASFAGRIPQTPPAFSAIKQDGVPLYRLARRGQAVAPAPRTVTIHRIELLRWEPPFLEVAVDCDPGTYMRSLAHDLGQALGCGAVLAGLVRTRSGAFTLADAATPEELAAAATSGTISRYVRPLRDALTGLIPVVVAEAEAAALRQGRPIPARETVTPDVEACLSTHSHGEASRQATTSTIAPDAEACPGTRQAAASTFPADTEAGPRRRQGYAVFPDGAVVAILRYDTDRQAWWPNKVFTAES